MTEDPNAITLQRIADALERLAEAADAIAALMAAGPALAAGATPSRQTIAAELAATGDLPDAGDWAEWYGGECPVPAGTLVDIRHRDGDAYHGVFAKESVPAMDWSIAPELEDRHPGDIIAYRIHKEPAK